MNNVLNTAISKWYRSHPNPAVELILNTKPDPKSIISILSTPAMSSEPKVNAIIALVLSESGLYSPEEANKLAEEVYHKPSHVDLHIIFLAVWYCVLLDQKEPPFLQLKSLEACMNSLLHKDTPPEVKAIAKYATVQTYFLLGNFKKQLELVSDLVDNIPKESPYYEKLRRCCAMDYLWHGRAAEIDWHHDKLEYDEFDDKGLIICEFINHALTGNLERACEMLDQTKALAGHKYMRLGQVAYDQTCRLIALLCNGNSIGLSGNQPEPSWVKSTKLLLNRNHGQALIEAKKHAEEQSQLTGLNLDFVIYTLIRSELACGNGGAAKRLLLQLRDQGTETFMDEFYFARAERLLGNYSKAAEHFGEVRRSVKKLKAEGMFEFEVRLATELKTVDLLELDQINQKNKVKSTVSIASSNSLTGLDIIVSKSDLMDLVKRKVEDYAPLNIPVLITGETGTGKELVARSLHDLGPRKTKPFIAINCGAFTDSMIESELFGYTRGAFTGAQGTYLGIFRSAGDGTVFLDEIGEISPRVQVALLRVLDAAEVRPVGSSEVVKVKCRIVAATNRNLHQLVAEGKFRQDLYFRLRRLEINILPLRDRVEDIPELVEYFFNLGRESKEPVVLSPALINCFKTNLWPGNVRELKNIIERIRIQCSDKRFYDLGDLTPHLGEPKIEPRPKNDPTVVNEMPAYVEAEVVQLLTGGTNVLRRVERLRELFHAHGKLKVSEIAEILSISYSTASRYIQKLVAEDLIEKVTPTMSTHSHYYVLRRDSE